MSGVDLNEIRDKMIQNAQLNVPYPPKPSDKAFVDDAGGILDSTAASNKDPRRISELHQGTFATPTSRAAKERDIVAAKFPPGTHWVAHEQGDGGWFFVFRNEFAEEFAMYAYWDASTSLYKVKMVRPKWTTFPEAHRDHLFRDGNICLADSVGLPTLDGAYAKAVFFANAWTIVQKGHDFPFAMAS